MSAELRAMTLSKRCAIHTSGRYVSEGWEAQRITFRTASFFDRVASAASSLATSILAFRDLDWALNFCASAIAASSSPCTSASRVSVPSSFPRRSADSDRARNLSASSSARSPELSIFRSSGALDPIPKTEEPHSKPRVSVFHSSDEPAKS